LEGFLTFFGNLTFAAVFAFAFVSLNHYNGTDANTDVYKIALGYKNVWRAIRFAVLVFSISSPVTYP